MARICTPAEAIEVVREVDSLDLLFGPGQADRFLRAPPGGAAFDRRGDADASPGPAERSE